MTNLEFRVLGPVQVLRGGHKLELGRTTLTVLASLALSPGRIIPADRLIDHVWDTSLPAHPRAALHNGVSRLRRLLGMDVVQMPGWGYRLCVDAGQLDLLRFDEYLAEAMTAVAAEREEDGAGALDAALRLWHEPLLANIGSPALHREVVPWLTERYLQAVELRAELGLRLGRCDALAEELRAVVSAHPLREHLTALLMIALAHSGRRSDALIAYGTLRCALRDELGVDPTAELQGLHLRLLRADPGPEVPRRVITSRAHRQDAPRPQGGSSRA